MFKKLALLLSVLAISKFAFANTLTRITSNLNILNSLNKLNWCTHYSIFLEKIN